MGEDDIIVAAMIGDSSLCPARLVRATVAPFRYCLVHTNINFIICVVLRAWSTKGEGLCENKSGKRQVS
jgi:hypothetical protein